MDGTGWAVWVAIAAGSACGGVGRHVLTEAVARAAGGGFPWGTLLVNVFGSAAIGVLTAMVDAGAPVAWTPAVRHAAITGLLGGFTTFSAFSVQTLALLQQGQPGAAAANLVLSVLLGVAACWAGMSVVAGLTR